MTPLHCATCSGSPKPLVEPLSAVRVILASVAGPGWYRAVLSAGMLATLVVKMKVADGAKSEFSYKGQSAFQ